MRRFAMPVVAAILVGFTGASARAGQPPIPLRVIPMHVGQRLQLDYGQWRGNDKIDCVGNNDRLYAWVLGDLGPAPLGLPEDRAYFIKRGQFALRENNGLSISIKVISPTRIVLGCVVHRGSR